MRRTPLLSKSKHWSIEFRMNARTIRNIVLLWLAWCVIIIGYMNFSAMRYAPSRADEAVAWSANETRRNSLEGKPYLLEPFMNTQVAWDSEYYLAIATGGYDDPGIGVVVNEDGVGISKSYAFFPFYPMVMSVLRVPFEWIGFTPIAASTAAGVIISLLGTLVGMIALYDMVRKELGDEGAMRTAFMMLIFPTSLFFATVYTEGLFVALAFSSLALMRRNHLIAAAVLAALATGTRAVGGSLVVPLVLTWLWNFRQAEAADRKSLFISLPFLSLPLVAYGIWRMAYGAQFEFIEAEWFGNGLLEIAHTLEGWRQILVRAGEYPETATIVIMGLSSIALAILSCLVNLRKYPQLALFGLAALIIPLTGGWTGTQSAIRYVLVVPTLWIMLGQWGRNSTFDRAWTLLSILLLAMQAFLFSYDFWVA